MRGDGGGVLEVCRVEDEAAMRERDPMGMDRPGVVAASTRATVSGCGSAGSWPTAGSGWLDVWDMIGPDVAWRARHACAACGPAAADRGRFQDLTIGPTVMVGAAPTVGRMGELASIFHEPCAGTR